MHIKRISFNKIEHIWKTYLWTNRSSKIEPVSVMTWPFDGDPDEYDMSILNYTPTFWGCYIDNKLVGVNSGHKTSATHYRSRGIWVDPEYRKRHIAQNLFGLTQHQAILEKAEFIWSIPRKTALTAYTSFGFNTVGEFFKTETSEANIYVIKTVQDQFGFSNM